MAAHTKVGVGYDVQVAVDAKNKLIVEQAVTNQVADMGLLTETSEPAREILGVETIDVVADRGYFKIEDIEACEQAGCVPPRSLPQRGSSVREGLFRKDEFRYDAGLDGYLCPAGKLLAPIRRGRMRAPFSASKTKTFSIAWPSASKRGRRFSTTAARSSSTRSAASSSGIVSGRLPDGATRLAQRARRWSSALTALASAIICAARSTSSASRP